MILMYHKVDIVTPTMWWITPETLRRHLAELRGLKIVHLDDYDPADARQFVLTFDDAYENTYRHALPILEEAGVPFEVFVAGNLIGDWNDFDHGEPRTRFASVAQLLEMSRSLARIQWHSRTHPTLTSLNDEQLAVELRVPDSLKQQFPAPHFRWFSYPYGAHDERVVRQAREMFTGAVSVREGDPRDRWQLLRTIVTESTDIPALIRK